MQADGWTAVLDIGPGIGIVVGAQDDAQAVQWLHLPGSPGALLIIPRAVTGDTAADNRLLLDDLQQRPEPLWRPVCSGFVITSGELLLIHAADTGLEVEDVESEEYAVIGQAIPCHVTAGLYVVEERALLVPAQSADPVFVLCRFRPADPPIGGR